MLEISGLSKIYGTRRVVDSVDLTIQRGEFIGVIGRSGAGKSTLLRMLNRLTEPSEGKILWQGQAVSELEGYELRLWRRRCAMIFQQFNLDRKSVV